MTDVSNLRVGDTYNSRIGPVVYLGLDHYYGETTYKFEVPGNPRPHYERPESLSRFLVATTPVAGDVLKAATDVCHAWRDNAANTNFRMVKALIEPIAALGRALTASAPSPVVRWRHKKRGSTYTEIGRGTLQIAAETVLQDEDEVVIYRGSDGRFWVRPVAEFEDGRFEKVE